MYATNCPGASSMILECFIPTVKAFSGIGYTDIVGKVDVNDVINRMVNLTRPSINKYDTKVSCITDYHLLVQNIYLF